MRRRPLGDVVSEIAMAVQPDPVRHGGVRVNRLAVDMPLEVEFQREAGNLLVLADLPRWRWRSVFDRDPGRMTLQLHEEPLP